jgi:hypothetical protein
MMIKLPHPHTYFIGNTWWLASVKPQWILWSYWKNVSVVEFTWP